MVEQIGCHRNEEVIPPPHDILSAAVLHALSCREISLDGNPSTEWIIVQPVTARPKSQTKTTLQMSCDRLL